MSASESASRSSANFESIVIRDSSISRISARWPRMIPKTSSAVTGSWVECVSAGTRSLLLLPSHRRLEAVDDAAVHTVGGEADRVDDGAGRRRAVRDHAHPVD